MTAKKEAFLRILELELQDLQDDIEELIRICNSRFENGEISNYVHVENVGVLGNEKAGVAMFVDEIRKMDFSACPDVDSCAAIIDAHIDRWIHDMGVVPATRIFIRRKLEKVRHYVVQHTA